MRMILSLFETKGPYKRLSALLFVSFVVAGCLSSTPSVEDLTLKQAKLKEWPQYTYECPHVNSAIPQAGACVSVIPTPADSIYVRGVGIHPQKPGNVVIAAEGSLGTNGLHPQEAPNLHDSSTTIIYASQDDGSSWNEKTLIVPPPRDGISPLRYSVPTDLSFDEGGVAHLVGYNGDEVGNLLRSPDVDAYYTVSSNGGIDWTEPQYVSDDARTLSGEVSIDSKGDRYLTLKGERTRILRSTDQGATWTNLEKIPRPCFQAGRVTFHESQGYAFCLIDNHNVQCSYDAKILRITSSQEVRDVGLVECVNSNAQIFVKEDGTLILSSRTRIARSHNGGSDWTDWEDVLKNSTLAQNWFIYSVAAQFDDWGGLHLLIRGYSECMPVLDCRNIIGHVVLNPDNMQILHEQELTSEEISDYGSYVDLAISGNLGFLVWSKDSELQYTRLHMVK